MYTIYLEIYHLICHNKNSILQAKDGVEETRIINSKQDNWVGNFSEGKGINEKKVNGTQSVDKFLKKKEEEKVEMSGLKTVRIFSRLVLPSVTIIFILGYHL